MMLRKNKANKVVMKCTSKSYCKLNFNFTQYYIPIYLLHAFIFRTFHSTLLCSCFGFHLKYIKTNFNHKINHIKLSKKSCYLFI